MICQLEISSISTHYSTMNKLHLAIIACVCWAASISLGFYGTFRMAGLVRDASRIISRTNDTGIIPDITSLHDEIYKASRVEGVGTDAIFSVLCLYILLCSFPYFTDWSTRFRGLCGHKLFWFGLALDITGIILCFNGFSQYGGNNPQNGTAYISSGMTCIAIGSYSIIYRYEKDEQSVDSYQNFPEGGHAPAYNPGISQV